MHCLILSIRNGVCLKVLVWSHYFLFYTSVNSLKLQVVVFLMFMSMLMILSFTFRFLQIILMSNWILFLLSKIECAAAITSWMSEDKLKLNDDKTWISPSLTKQQLAMVCMKYIKVGCVEISPSSRVENLRVWFDSSVNMCSQKLCASAFFSVYLQHKAYQEVPIQG